MKIEIFYSATDIKYESASKIRKTVFSDEQGIPYELDDDGYDKEAWHALFFVNNEPAGSGRLVINGEWGVLARIAVLKKHRGMGHAVKVIEALELKGVELGLRQFELYPHAYLESFYSNLGYITDPDYSEEVAGYKLIRMHKKRD